MNRPEIERPSVGLKRSGFTRARQWTVLGLVVASIGCAMGKAKEAPGTVQFRKEIQPILEEYCHDCHGGGSKKGGVILDEFNSEKALLGNRELWFHALKNLRSEMMPPPKKPQPSPEQKQRIEAWIKGAVFQIDPKNPDPGRTTVRRLNRVEYRNTIFDLMGVDYNTTQEFPPDDTGHGFDNIADVLTISPMLLEKYLDAAKAIVAEAVPMAAGVVAEKPIPGRAFQKADGSVGGDSALGPLVLSYYEPATVSHTHSIQHAGQYQLVVDLTANERYVEARFDTNKCRLVFKADGQELLSQEFTREGGKPFKFAFDRDWSAGDHKLEFAIEWLTPEAPQIRSLTLRLNSVTVRGPMDEKYWVAPKNYKKFFTRKTPEGAAGRRAYAREILAAFATKALRMPADDATVDRLVALAESIYTQPKMTFEKGIAQSMVAVLASPRFLFREEGTESKWWSNLWGKPHPLVDEYALASRLSYFLWSTMPDAELFQLASEKQLRINLAAQVKRLLADPRAEALTVNFSGQWLQARDIESVQIDARSVLAREDAPTPPVVAGAGTGAGAGAFGRGGRGRGRGFGFGRGRAQLDADLRKSMRRETEMYFGHVVKEDRSVLELIDSNYTFLNEALAKHYALTNLNVTGTELRRVELPPESPRGGILTQGTVLAVTSNPTRTSPVKRGLFILENVLGTPPPPPPPDIPALEEAAKDFKDRQPSLRETLELHRNQPLCSSCHDRMDPLGLALENFNAMGMWREKDSNLPVEVSGTLITGESFTNIQQMKRILVTEHSTAFYRTLTEKMLTYALGRGLEYYDLETMDQIVERLRKENGKFSALLMGIVESAPFQKRRNPRLADDTKSSEQAAAPEPLEQRAELKIKP